MKDFLARARPSVVGIALVAILSIAGIATANKAIRDGSINTRDLRDGSLRGIDVRDGSVELADLSAEANALAASATLFDPRAHGASGCCLSWARGPETIAEAVPAGADPIPNADSGRAWRSAVLDPGTYVVQTTGQAGKAGAASVAAATRLFLGGQPAGDGGGYVFYPASEAGFPVSYSSATVIEVGAGNEDQRRLVQRAISLGDPTSLNDNLLVWKVTPR